MSTDREKQKRIRAIVAELLDMEMEDLQWEMTVELEIRGRLDGGVKVEITSIPPGQEPRPDGHESAVEAPSTVPCAGRRAVER
jgi:hypothetical protein